MAMAGVPLEAEQACRLRPDKIQQLPQILLRLAGPELPADSGSFAILLLYGENQEAPAPIALNSEAFCIRVLFNLAGPVLDGLERGVTLVVDEVNLGLHPHAVESLISMFCDQETNTKNAQIIFTTHDPTIVLTTYVERDQVLLMEKSGDD